MSYIQNDGTVVTLLEFTPYGTTVAAFYEIWFGEGAYGAGGWADTRKVRIAANID